MEASYAQSRTDSRRSVGKHGALQDSLAEWSKALASGASPQGRGFEPHSCHLRSARLRREPKIRGRKWKEKERRREREADALTPSALECTVPWRQCRRVASLP